MIIDLILDRKDGERYDPEKFYRDVMGYGSIGNGITRALDDGTNADVVKELCNYIDKQDYNPKIKDYIKSVKWLNDSITKDSIVNKTFKNNGTELRNALEGEYGKGELRHLGNYNFEYTIESGKKIAVETSPVGNGYEADKIKVNSVKDAMIMDSKYKVTFERTGDGRGFSTKKDSRVVTANSEEDAIQKVKERIKNEYAYSLNFKAIKISDECNVKDSINVKGYLDKTGANYIYFFDNDAEKLKDILTLNSAYFNEGVTDRFGIKAGNHKYTSLPKSMLAEYSKKYGINVMLQDANDSKLTEALEVLKNYGIKVGGHSGNTIILGTDWEDRVEDIDNARRVLKQSGIESQAVGKRGLQLVDSKMFKVTDKKTGKVRLARAFDSLEALSKVAGLKNGVMFDVENGSIKGVSFKELDDLVNKTLGSSNRVLVTSYLSGCLIGRVSPAQYTKLDEAIRREYGNKFSVGNRYLGAPYSGTYLELN